jgi:hypothetical protein
MSYCVHNHYANRPVTDADGKAYHELVRPNQCALLLSWMMVLSSSNLRFERRRVPSYVQCFRIETWEYNVLRTYPLFGEFASFLILRKGEIVIWAVCLLAYRRTFEFLNNSITRRSYAENPTTSRTVDRTSLVLADRIPLR